MMSECGAEKEWMANPRDNVYGCVGKEMLPSNAGVTIYHF